MSHLAIGDILAVGVALKRGSELVERLGQAKGVISRLRMDSEG
jgi:RpiR family carbohydrate utilization transcriptional regulator